MSKERCHKASLSQHLSCVCMTSVGIWQPAHDMRTPSLLEILSQQSSWFFQQGNPPRHILQRLISLWWVRGFREQEGEKCSQLNPCQTNLLMLFIPCFTFNATHSTIHRKHTMNTCSPCKKCNSWGICKGPSQDSLTELGFRRWSLGADIRPARLKFPTLSVANCFAQRLQFASVM